MRRLYRLVNECLSCSEPILLAEPTGCSKTTVVQMLSLLRSQKLRIINCHQHTEARDI